MSDNATAILPLSKRLRMAISDLHAEAEGTTFAEDLTRGGVPAHVYANYLNSLHPVYCSLEKTMTLYKDDPRLGPVYFPVLFRTERLEADLRFFQTLSGSDEPAPPVPGAEAYADRIASLADGKPHRVAAHAYVRYLGDLSGGQEFRKILADAYGLDSNGDGIRFYDFSEAGPPGPFKQTFRGGLDALRLSDGEAAEAIEEAREAFRLNIRMFSELEADRKQ